MDDGQPVEFAVEVAPDQVGAGVAVLQIAVDDLTRRRREPPLEAPWLNAVPLFAGTRIRGLALVPSRHGAGFEQVRGRLRRTLGHVRTLQPLTWAESEVLRMRGWAGLLEATGGRESLLDIRRQDAAAPATTDLGAQPVVVSRLHETYPPRWVERRPDGMCTSLTGRESPEYMQDTVANFTVWSVASFVEAFPWTARFLTIAAPGETGVFSDDSGAFEWEAPGPGA